MAIMHKVEFLQNVNLNRIRLDLYQIAIRLEPSLGHA